MKKLYTICVLVSLLTKAASAQSTILSVIIDNDKEFSGYVSVYHPLAKFDSKQRGTTLIALNSSHAGTCRLYLDSPQFVVVNSDYSFVKGNHPDKYFSYVLFLAPGDNLVLEIDPAKINNNLVVTGTGSNNNQPGIFALTYMDTRRFKRDTTPARLMAAIEKQDMLNRINLKKYINKYKPSAAFVANANLNLDYFAASVYAEFNHVRNFGNPAGRSSKWQLLQDSLLNTVKLNNDKALTCYNYNTLITEFLDGKTNHLWFEQNAHPPLFYKKEGQVLLANNKAPFNDKTGSAASEMTIKKYFGGQTAEYLYAELLKKDIVTKNYHSFLLTFNHFKRSYPASKYIPQFNEDATKIAIKLNEMQKLAL